MADKRIRIICGHYGSGKSEFSVNFAKMINTEDNKVALVDLDVVNPYFRSREKTEELEAIGIRAISSSIAGSNADLPALSGQISVPILDKSYELIIDVGGDHVGARVLGRYNNDIIEQDYDMLMVINANRPDTQTMEQVIDFIDAIEKSSGLKVTGLINNTHLMKSTTIEDVLRGEELAEKVSAKRNIPIKYTSCLESLYEELPNHMKERYVPVKLELRAGWMC